VRYPNGRFLGFKAISDASGGQRPTTDFSRSLEQTPGDTGDSPNGGSWLLYDPLVFYLAGRIGIADRFELLHWC
jgi:hypothetical protein